MRVDRDFKLDFDDVLIRPKRSTLSSRRLVDLNRKFEFRHSNETWEGIPVIAANMDTTGTFEMAKKQPQYFGGLGRANNGEHE